MSRKIKMPKTRMELEDILMRTFEAGCNHGYGIEHSINVSEQERLGAEHWIGKISDEEFYRRWDELREY